ncbi:MAG: hypothetical protein KDD45_09775 [Bdellovibrionales bacterium]|nr:hypothetical protein [Bdellovibrionales bacterium]
MTIKQLPLKSIHRINQELALYREIEDHNLDVSISKLYQIYTHGDIFLFVKEPYEFTFQEFTSQHEKDYVRISWEFIAKTI